MNQNNGKPMLLIAKRGMIKTELLFLFADSNDAIFALLMPSFLESV